MHQAQLTNVYLHCIKLLCKVIYSRWLSCWRAIEFDCSLFGVITRPFPTSMSTAVCCTVCTNPVNCFFIRPNHCSKLIDALLEPVKINLLHIKKDQILNWNKNIHIHKKVGQNWLSVKRYRIHFRICRIKIVWCIIFR